MKISTPMKILKALEAAPDKQMEQTPLRKASGATVRGFWRVVEKMQSDRLIHRKWDQPQIFTITFGGMKRLSEEG